MNLRNGLIGLLVGFGLLLAGCPDSHNHGSPTQGELRLDDGRKWQSDDHTRASISRIRSAVTSADTGTVEGARALGASVKKELDVLIRGCTMTGEAHNQLHLFLGRFIPAVDSLAEAPDAAAAKQAHKQVTELLDTYDRHFE